MNRIYFGILYIITLLSVSVSAQTNCFTITNLVELDARWEQAQLDLNLEFIEDLLTDDFIWIHNHANTIDDKSRVIERIQRYISDEKMYSKSRVSNNVKASINGSTGIVSGFTKVDNGNSKTDYHFLRTYIYTKGKCKLIASQTMAVPGDDS